MKSSAQRVAELLDMASTEDGFIKYQVKAYAYVFNKLHIERQLVSINLAIGLIDNSDPQWDELQRLKEQYEKQLEELQCDSGN